MFLEEVAFAEEGSRHFQRHQLIARLTETTAREQTRSQKDALYREASSRTGFHMGRVILLSEACADFFPVRNSMAQPEDCAIPIVTMSSDRLFLSGVLASSARLRFTGTINLPRLFQRLTPNRTPDHRTFLP